MPDFQWETEEEIDWDSHETAAHDPKTIRYRRTYLIWGGLALILAIALGVTVSRQLQERIAEGQALVKADLLASVELIRETAEKQDRDVFTLLLSGRDPDWADQMEELVEQGLLTDRTLLGLEAQGDPTVTVELSSNLLAAEVTSEQLYRYQSLGRPPRLVSLATTAVYRKGENRWLLAPPEEAFWGERQGFESDALLVGYDERDADFAEQFATHFLATFETFCRQTDALTCPTPSELQIVVSFSNDPATLKENVIHAPILTPTHFADPELIFLLPSPTLIGAPLTEAGTAVLNELYTVQLLRGVLNVLLSSPDGDLAAAATSTDCCAHPLFRRALIDYELAQVDILAWPITLDDYEQLIEADFTLDSLTPLWQASSTRELLGQERPFYTAIDFLLQEGTTLSTAELLQNMPPRRSFIAWIQRINDPNGSGATAIMERLNSRLNFLVAQRPFVEGKAVLPSNATLYAVCNNSESFDEPDEINVMQVASNGNAELFRALDEGFALIESTPTHDGFLLLNGSFSADEQFLWQIERIINGESTPIFPLSGGNVFSFLNIVPENRLVIYKFGNDADGLESRLVDMSTCGEMGCVSNNLAGQTVWSPSGERSLIQLRPTFDNSTIVTNGRYSTTPEPFELDDFAPIFFGNENGIVTQSSEIGANPFWLDDNRFGFVRLTPGEFRLNARELAIYSLANDNPDILLTSEQLNAALPATSNLPTPLLALYAAPNPHDPNQLFVITESGLVDAQGAIFRFDVTEEEVTYLFDLVPDFHNLSFSPNGRYLVVEQSQFTSSGATTTLTLFDLETETSQAIPFSSLQSVFSASFHEWSPNGEQLAFLLAHDLIGILNPATQEKGSLSHSFGTCADFAWVQN